MAWTSPITFVANAVLTAAQLNVNLRDNLNYLKGVAGGVTIDNALAARGDGVQGAIGSAGDLASIRSGGASGTVFFNSAGSRYIHYDGSSYVMPGANLSLNGGTAWHSANDGTGSGLDADLVDGQHASAFATSGHNHTGTTIGQPTVSTGEADAGNQLRSAKLVHVSGRATVSGSTLTTVVSYGCSIARAATGRYTVTFDRNFANTNYLVVAMTGVEQPTNGRQMWYSPSDMAVGSCRINFGNGAADGEIADFSFHIVGDQA